MEMVAFLPWEGAVEQRMHHQPTFWKFACSEQAVSPLEMRLLTVPEHNKSKEDILETQAMAIIDQSAV
jgi:hypothetical protein